MPRGSGASYRPTYTNNDEHPDNSRYNPERHAQHRDQEPYYSTDEVDSWRSYRDDATNLQQIASYANTWIPYYTHQPYQPIFQQPHQFYNAYGLNPAAPVFHPTGYSPVTNPAQSFFAPYQSLRVSNGQQETQTIRQARFYSSLANNANATLLENAPLGIEQHRQASSTSIPSSIKRSVLHRISPSASPPPAPSPTRDYLSQAALEPVNLKVPQKLLVVLDLNGTLLKRTRNSGSNVALRPGVVEFMEYLLANYVVMVYSSARPENVIGMVTKLLSPAQRNQLVAVWARDKLGLNKDQYFAKVQVYKKLEKIWADQDIQSRAERGCRWDQTNTILVDDSHLKALAQPYNLLRVEEFLNDRPGNNTGSTVKSKDHSNAVDVWIKQQKQIIDDLKVKLEKLKFTTDVSRLIRCWQQSNSEGTVSTNNQRIEAEQTQLLTPKSPMADASDSDQSDGGVNYGNFTYHSASNDNCNASDRSVSPINDAVWAEILGQVESQASEDSGK